MGTGAAPAGNNTFTYYSSPNGNTVEYTSDLEEVDEASWQPQVYTPGLEVMDQWGTGRIITGNKPHAEMAPDKGPMAGARMISTALIVGGGVGGMTAAIALARRGVEVTLIDADPTWQRSTAPGSASPGYHCEAFEDLGILDEVRARVM